MPRRAFAKFLIFLEIIGAGEAIRTPDPNLGKVNNKHFLPVPLHSGAFRIIYKSDG